MHGTGVELMGDRCGQGARGEGGHHESEVQGAGSEGGVRGDGTVPS